MDQAALRQELAELTAAVRAFVEWHAITGAAGLPVGGAPHEAAEPAPARPADASTSPSAGISSRRHTRTS